MDRRRLRLMRQPREALLALLCCMLVPLAAEAQSQQPAQQTTQRDDLVGRLNVGALDNQKLEGLARENDLSTLSVMAANWGISQFWPDSADKILLPTAHILPQGARDGILVNVAEFRLYYFKDRVLVLTAPIGTGVDGLQTPLGDTKVVRKMKDPAWYPTPEARAEHPDWPVMVPPGPDNPMGQYALYLGWKYMAIHGSNDDFGIGRPYTRGCIRLYREDIKTLYPLAPIGTPVQVVDQRVKLGWHAGELFLEAQPDAAQFAELGVQKSFTIQKGDDMKATIMAAAGARANDIDWDVASIALERRSGVPTQITNVNSHYVNIYEPNLALSENLRALLRPSFGFAPTSKPSAKPTRPEPSDAELLREHRLKFPYNI
jgi:L,D-transpeptidase ErfK/SrfK